MPSEDFVPEAHDATPAAPKTEPRPVEANMIRARQHRRRAIVAAALTTVAVLAVAAGGVALILGRHDAATAPVHPSPSPSAPASPSPDSGTAPDDTAEAAAVARDGRLVAYAVNAKGSLLTIWQRCASWTEVSRCRTAWQLQSHAGINRALVRGNFAVAAAAGDSFVVTSWNRPGIVVDDSGRWRPLQSVPSGKVAAGDAFVQLGKSLGVVDPATAQLWPLPAPDGVEGWVAGTIAADGTVWATPSVPAPPIDVRISWLQPGSATSAWQHHTFSTTFDDGPAPGPIAVAGDHVAALAMHDGVDVATYGVFAVTTDAGATWSDLHPSDLPFDNVDALAATSSGTLYVATTASDGAGRLFRSTDRTWTRFTEVSGARGVHQLVAAGDLVIARGGTLSRPEALTLDDAGHVTSRAQFR
jgi:hypothetical protein